MEEGTLAGGRLRHGDVDDAEIPAFTSFAMEYLREIITDQIDKAD